MTNVACYCRVSTDHADQLNSFQAQQRYFRMCIEANPDWTLTEVYADEGTSGTEIDNRVGFRRMIKDAMEGKFRLLLTKEVSRFSRNILDTIACTRQLKQAGVTILFLTDGIHTADPDAELRLSIMASIAQEESRKTSERVKWGQMRQMEQGIVFGHSLLGYIVKNGNLTVEPEGAAVVKLIFRKYAAEGKGTAAIVRDLEAMGLGTWSCSRISKILKNEKYVGDLVQKKSFTPDYLTHKRKTNQGEEPLVIIHNHHEPIISRMLWEKTQQELQRRSRKKQGTSGCSAQYPLSGKIRCGQCGSYFVCRRKTHKDGSSLLRWRCAKAGSKGCSIGQLLRNDDAMDMVRQAFSSLQLDLQALTQHTTAQLPVQDHTLQHLNRKLQCVMDAYFSGVISHEEMQQYRLRCQSAIQALEQTQPDRSIIHDKEKINELLRKDETALGLLQQITVFSDRPLELRFVGLSRVFHFEYRQP